MGWVNKNNNADGEFERIKLSEGESFTGLYAGPRDMSGVNGAFVSHEFNKEGDTEKVYTVSGASLNRGLEGVEPGTLTRLTYIGEKTTKSNRTVKAYDVAVYADDDGKAKASF